MELKTNMSIRFAAPHTPGRLPAPPSIARALARRSIERAANDNGDMTGHDAKLRDALRMFAEHGLGAARAARGKAEKAFFAGDRQSYDWWLGVTRTLDRRLAEEASTRLPIKEIS
ncbi:hypothetical protein [Erythrobacter sp. THAF29]|uniref:hypothetical protein n=1 Tax=Erythrobacter sp. THAF29 TaxID=2587851 RepID=UPI0012A7F4B5|nr:hypothetical protein [Erythrobacter sp. THAF29]QFT78234.1 hypothetical protein FIU90_11855 [Erythrobacter sp. THAF29]